MSREKIVNSITRTIEQIKTIKTPEARLKAFIKSFKFKELFPDHGVSGITGICTHKIGAKNVPVVFKIPKHVGFAAEHEFNVMYNLNNIRSYCPNFCNTFGMLRLPIGLTELYSDSESEGDSEDDSESESENKLQRNPFELENSGNTLATVLFVEYIGDIKTMKSVSFDKFLDKNMFDTKLVYSQLCQILLALETAQISDKFTHYDLHLDNIYMKKCNKDKVIVYVIKDKQYTIPTYGYYPVIIDMGISYIDVFEGHQMTSHTDHYKYGFQSALFDRLNDVHHLMFAFRHNIFSNVLYRVSKFKNQPKKYDELFKKYKFILNKIKKIFSPIRIHRRHGWKILKYDIQDQIEKFIEKNTDCFKIKGFDDVSDKFLSILNGLIILPFKATNIDEKEFRTSMEYIVKEVMKFDHGEHQEDDLNVHDTLKQFVVAYVSNQSDKQSIDEKQTNKINYKQLWENIKRTLSKEVKGKTADMEGLFKHFKVVSLFLSGFYYKLTQEHAEIINEAYKKIDIKSPIDMVDYIYKNCNMHYTADKNTEFVIHDINKKSIYTGVCKDVSGINKALMVNKGKFVKSG